MRTQIVNNLMLVLLFEMARAEIEELITGACMYIDCFILLVDSPHFAQTLTEIRKPKTPAFHVSRAHDSADERWRQQLQHWVWTEEHHCSIRRTIQWMWYGEFSSQFSALTSQRSLQLSSLRSALTSAPTSALNSVLSSHFSALTSALSSRISSQLPTLL